MSRLLPALRVGCTSLIVGHALVGCAPERVEADPTYEADVAPLFAQKCASCHQGDAPPGGWRATSYVDVVGCVASDGAPATRPDAAPILRVLGGSHAGYVSDDEREILERWIAAGAPAFRGGVHDPSFVDPRSERSHGRFLRARRWAPMLDPGDADACGRCHDGAPNHVAGALPAPRATSCQSCHTQPEGPLACGTCHGDGGARAAPPRDACLSPGASGFAHAAHVEPRAAKSEGLSCATCHPTPSGAGDFAATHGDGAVQVRLAQIAGPLARFDAATKTCTTQCHQGPGAARPAPVWTDPQPSSCGSCHGAPPPAHPEGRCSLCHREADDTGTKLLSTKLHLDGRVQVGDGSGQCGSCHGAGNDPWPSTGAHATHAAPKQAVPVACESCHVVPGPGAPHSSGRGFAAVRFAGLARKGGASPTWSATTKTCADTYCHAGVSGGSQPAPTWLDPSGAGCGTCHGTPPSPPHVASSGCGTGACHGGVVSGGAITAKGKAAHVDGKIDLAVP